MRNNKVFDISIDFRESTPILQAIASHRHSVSNYAVVFATVCRWRDELQGRTGRIYRISPASIKRIVKVLPSLWLNKDEIYHLKK